MLSTPTTPCSCSRLQACLFVTSLGLNNLIIYLLASLSPSFHLFVCYVRQGAACLFLHLSPLKFKTHPHFVCQNSGVAHDSPNAASSLARPPLNQPRPYPFLQPRGTFGRCWAALPGESAQCGLSAQ